MMALRTSDKAQRQKWFIKLFYIIKCTFWLVAKLIAID
jgi:hypothetical protein